jgi:Mn2+/Fe2+ NRAMP family transporter
LNSTLLLVITAIVGTTVAPWQLFFQQSNVVDKRLSSPSGGETDVAVPRNRLVRAGFVAG